MEPLTAVGLASNVVQFISFAGDLISKGKEIASSADGTLLENREIEAVTQSLHDLSQALIAPKQDVRLQLRRVRKTTQAEQDLLRLCEDAKKVAETLLVALRHLKAQGGKKSSWTSFRQAFLAVLSAERVELLSARLGRYQQQINTALLVSLREQVSNQPDFKFEKDLVVDPRIKVKADWRKSLINDLREHDWHPSEEQDLQIFASHLAKGAEIDRERLHMLRIHHMLRFTELEERQESIAEAHKKTFEWIFQGDHRPSGVATDDEDTPQWDDFIEWLQNGKNMYWVTGKPGSGKSTLMKYLFQDVRTHAHIKSWRKQHDLLMAGFYFWNSGSTMQMSFLGLLQSLLYQAIMIHQHLIPHLFPTRWQSSLLFGRDLRPWTLSELKKALQTLVSIESLRFVIFIDGLDEFDQDPADLVSFITDLCNKPSATNNLKLCVSSRPWLVFEEHFAACPRLRLEDLTRPDIQAYVEEKLGCNPHWRNLIQFRSSAADYIMTEVVDRSSGVFLWVILVVGSLETGLRDGDTIDDLILRVERLPSSLEALFRDILERLDPDYVVQACELFLLAVAAVDPLIMLDVSFAVEGYDSCMATEVNPLQYNELCYIAENVRRRILSRCKGLLETHNFELQKYDATVHFLHRTVRDFFKSPDIKTYICSHAPDFDPIVNLCGASLKRLKTTAQYRQDRCVFTSFWISFRYCLAYAKYWEQLNGEPLVEYLDELDVVGDSYWNAPSLRSNGEFRTWMEELLSTGDASSFSNGVTWSQVTYFRDLMKDNPGSTQYPHWTNTCWILNPAEPELLERIRPRRPMAFPSFADYMSRVEFEKYAKIRFQRKAPPLINATPLTPDAAQVLISKKKSTPKGLLKSVRSIWRVRATKTS